MTLKQAVFFGTEDFSVPTLTGLIEKGWGIKAVVTKPDSKRGRGKVLASPKVAQIARTHKIKVLQPIKLIEIEEELKNMDVDCGVLVSYGKIIPLSTIKLFPTGIINVHPSLLPKYRGPSPIESAILSGDKQTGVSIMKLTAQMDAGPIYVQEKVALDGSETKPELYNRLSVLGASLLLRNIEKITSEELLPFPQDDLAATYTNLLKKLDGQINWNEPAEIIERKVRAFQGYPKTRATIYGKDVIITRARVANNANDGKLVVKCSPGYLEVQELVAPSGRTISGSDFIRGYRAG